MHLNIYIYNTQTSKHAVSKYAVSLTRGFYFLILSICLQLPVRDISFANTQVFQDIVELKWIKIDFHLSDKKHFET